MSDKMCSSDPFCIITRRRDFSIFKTAAVRHLEFLKIKFQQRAFFRDTLTILMPNFVEIGHTVADISRFFHIFLLKCKNSLADRA